MISALSAFVLLASTGNQTLPADGDYCLREFISGDTGRGLIPLGDLEAFARIQTVNGDRQLRFSTKMPDSARILWFEAPITRLETGEQTFTFTDGWGNQGAGTLSPDARIDLRVTKNGPPGSEDIRRNYNAFSLSPGTCPKP
ncbi:hypothetical protein D3C80_1314660 [compost metagenome]